MEKTVRERIGIINGKESHNMGRVFAISDLHLCHDKEFVWKDRGYSSIEEHNKAIVENWNNVVNSDDIVYVLGDIVMKSLDDEVLFQHGIDLLKSLNGKLIIVRGNHDSEERISLYEQCDNVISANNAALYVKYPEVGGYTFYLSHYPTMVSHEKLKKIKNAVINLYGHTHQKTHFYMIDDKEHPYMYCCCMDAHNNTPVLFDDIIKEILQKKSEWKDEQ